MARARNIKPGFFRNADLVELPVETRLLFIGLWTLADREGRLEDRPKQIKMEVFPCDDINVEAGLAMLQQSGFLVRYEINGKKYAQVVNFTKHQMPHHKEVVSEIPAPPGFQQITKHTYDVSKELREQVFLRDGHACLKCGSKDDISLDHITPLASGGNNAITNLQTLCKSCNSSKGNTTKDHRKSNVESTLGKRQSNDGAHCLSEPLIPDSGFLIPDSGLLIADSGLPDSLPPAQPDSPSAGGGEGDFVDDQPEPDSAARFIPSDAARMMLAMKAEGISDGSASNPKFVELVKSGASPGELMDAARRAVKAGKGFNYAIGIAIRERQEAAALALTMPKGPLPAARSTAANETFAERDARIGRERWEEMTGRTHPDNIKTMPAATQFVEDITPQFLEHTR